MAGSATARWMCVRWSPWNTAAACRAPTSARSTRSRRSPSSSHLLSVFWRKPQCAHEPHPSRLLRGVCAREQVEERHRPAFVTRRLQVERDIVGDEYSFLKANAHARAKYSIPAPSWHRTYWHPEYSTDAYPTSDDFIEDVARLTREHIVDRLVELGCDYIQIDAPNYAQWRIDPQNRAAFEEHGHDMAAELVADAEFDSMVFDGLTGVTRAMHMCRGNAPGGMWAASGGYEAISKQVFPRLENLDRLLLEYDSDRAGTFAPLADVLPHHQVVLGLVTTKDGRLEDPDDIVARVEEATRYVPLDRLAISPQCGFASGEIARTMTLVEQEAKLHLIGDVARRVWR